MDCIFCKIIKGEIDSKRLYEDDKVIVMMDIYPEVDGHTLIIPKTHINDFTELDNDTLIHMHKIAKDMSKMLMEKLNTNSLTLIMNYGNRQAIKHVHLHLLPNYPIKSTSKIEDVYTKLTK